MLLTSNRGVESVVQLITVLVIFVLVLFVTLFVTKWLAGFQKQQQSGKNINVVEITKISPNHYAQILKIGSKYVAVAIGKDNVTVLATLDESELNLEENGNAQKPDFAAVFEKLKMARGHNALPDDKLHEEDEE